MAGPEIIPAILTGDPRELAQKIRHVETFASTVHIDIMDGVFVPPISTTAEDLAALHTSLHLELHLLVKNPLAMIREYLPLHPRRYILHPDGGTDLTSAFTMLREQGIETALGVAWEQTGEEWPALLPFLDQMTFVTVVPGYQGGMMQREVLERAARFHAAHKDILLEIDGGVNGTTVQDILSCHPDRLIVGSGLWKSADPAATYKHLIEQTEFT